MCSVTFWPNARGYRLAMNRDESLARVTGLPPARFVVGGRTIVHPGEPMGGTWICLNDRGVTFALINWYAITARASAPTVSRGEVLLTLRDSTEPEEAAARLRLLPLTQLNPFRMIGFFPGQQAVREWRWDVATLAEVPHHWSPGQWLSSGYDEPTAQHIRGATFETLRMEADAGSLPWLRRLHSSHGPERGPFSTCMHRADAATVSYTEIEIERDTRIMRHGTGSPCCGKGLVEAVV
ncbi:MAG TPA: NRDE family protein [Candidatus Limnocylindria bacterium]|jgi:hypothetical protein|nr:NRDE family protein [Candidatus Limnocylindria bacterium]